MDRIKEEVSCENLGGQRVFVARLLGEEQKSLLLRIVVESVHDRNTQADF